MNFIEFDCIALIYITFWLTLLFVSHYFLVDITLYCQRVDVEGVELEEEERSMMGWCQVRRKSGQEVKDVSTETRGWEEFYNWIGYLYLAH